MPPTDRNHAGVIVVASGTCSLCDHRFIGEEVLAFCDAAAVGGYAYVELRHLDDRGRCSHARRAADATDRQDHSGRTD